MPFRMPSDIEFHYTKNSGIAMGGSIIRISEKISQYFTHYLSSNYGYEFHTTLKELETLYKTFQENNFHKIEHDGRTVSDVSGDSLSIQWQDQCIQVGRGMHGQIKKEHTLAYHNCIGAIEALAEKDYAKNLQKITIQMDETIRKEFKFGLYGESFLHTKLFENNGTEKPVFSLLQGIHCFEIGIEEPYSEKLQVTIPVLKNHTTVLNLFLANQKLNWETIISR